jgi:hypothetical protein
MKSIGYDFGTAWNKHHETSATPRAELFIREDAESHTPINTTTWQHIGFVLSGDIEAGHGTIYADRASAGTNGIACYVRAPEQPTGPTTEQRITDLENYCSRVDETLTALAKRLHNINETDRLPPADTMTFYDHAFIAAAIACWDKKDGDLYIERSHSVAMTLTAQRRPA